MYHLTTCFGIFHKPIQTAIQIKSCWRFSNIKYVTQTHTHIRQKRMSFDFVAFYAYTLFFYIMFYVCMSVCKLLLLLLLSFVSPFWSFRLLLTLPFCSWVRFSVYSTIFIGIFISATNRSRVCFAHSNLVSVCRCIYLRAFRKKKINRKNSAQNKDNI